MRIHQMEKVTAGSPNNHPIEKENHLNQTPPFLGSSRSFSREYIFSVSVVTAYGCLGCLPPASMCVDGCIARCTSETQIGPCGAILPSLPVIPCEDRCLNPHSHLLFEDLKRGSFHTSSGSV